MAYDDDDDDGAAVQGLDTTLLQGRGTYSRLARCAGEHDIFFLVLCLCVCSVVGRNVCCVVHHSAIDAKSSNEDWLSFEYSWNSNLGPSTFRLVPSVVEAAWISVT